MTEPSMPTKTLAEGRFLSLQRRNGWEFVSRGNTRGVVAILALTEDDQVVLVEQHRVPLEGPVIELPAGLVGDHAGDSDESPRIAAERELLEETGYRSERWTDVSIELASSAGLTDETVQVFGARKAVQVGPGGGVAGECIQVHTVHLQGLADWLEVMAGRGIPADGRVWAVPLLAASLGLR